jgi:hypothetical protein
MRALTSSNILFGFGTPDAFFLRLLTLIRFCPPVVSCKKLKKIEKMKENEKNEKKEKLSAEKIECQKCNL